VTARHAGRAAGPPAMAAADMLLAARACYGWLLACVPRRMLRGGGMAPPGPHAVTVARVLGGRHLIQTLLTAGAGPAGVAPGLALGAGAAVDTLHAASMAGLAVMFRPLRRAALTDAALETGLAVAGLLAARAAAAPRAEAAVTWAAATSPRTRG
jgi:hypothetical protein